MDSRAAGERTGREGTERPWPSGGGVGEDPPPASLAFVDALPTVLLHADWIARGAAPAVCREWARPLHGDAHWRWLCERVALERGLYLPAGSCPSPKGWRAHLANPNPNPNPSPNANPDLNPNPNPNADLSLTAYATSVINRPKMVR